MMRIKRLIRTAVGDISMAIGRHVPQPVTKLISHGALQMERGRWLRRYKCHMNLRAHNRREVWMPIVERVQDQKVLYLEFGVWEGASMRFWSEHLSHPGSSLHGFDSFEGLPETEGKWWSKGQFDVNGRVPVIDDPRVQFFKGWFDQTLPDYTPPEHDVLVVNIDADLYSSTICVLRHLKPHIRRGSFLYFDEFHHPESEQRALEEFMDETHLNVSVVSGTKNFVHMCFECTSPP